MGDLAPSEAYGVGNVVVAMINTNVSEAIANSPGGSLLFGANPRISQAFKTAARYFNVIEDYEDPEFETKLLDVVKAGANLFSGYSNSFKASYAFETGKKISSTGRFTDEDVTRVEAALTLAGFQTKTETGLREVREIQFGDSSFSDNDISLWYTDLKRHLARRGTTTTEDDTSQRILAEAWRVFGQDRPRAINKITSLIQRDARAGDYTVIQGIMNKMGVIPNKEVWEMINRLPAGPARERLSENLQALEETQDGS